MQHIVQRAGVPGSLTKEPSLEKTVSVHLIGLTVRASINAKFTASRSISPASPAAVDAAIMRERIAEAFFTSTRRPMNTFEMSFERCGYK